VSELGFTVSLQGGFISLGSEAERIKETDWGEGTRNGVDSEGIKSGRLLCGGHRSEGSGRAEESGKRSSRLHVVGCLVSRLVVEADLMEIMIKCFCFSPSSGWSLLF